MIARQMRIRDRACVHAVVLAALLGARTAAALDLSGVYISQVVVFEPGFPCTLTFAQSGSALTVGGPCDFGSAIYTFDLSGSVDPDTGAFSLSGELLGLCEDPGEVTMTGSGDGEVFSATSTCGSVSSAVTGSKCSNGMIDPGEECEDGNTAAGDCCSPVCRFDPVGAACTTDSMACTLDVCDGAGHCQHPPAAAGATCESDLNACTDDLCDAAGLCTHPANTATCDDFNACTTADGCASASCVGGPIAPECVGPIDLTGDWEVTSSGDWLTPSSVRHFEQSGAILRSSLGQGDYVGAVNSATGAFQAFTPFTFFIASCLELIDAIATPDAQTFTGMVGINCGLDGFFGPYPATGRRCLPDTACACATAAACARPDAGARLVIRAEATHAPTRWVWSDPDVAHDFGDPTASSDYRICVETADEGYVEMAPHGSTWRRTRTGFRYRPTSGLIRSLMLKTTARKTVIMASLVPTDGITLPADTPLRVRLVRTGNPPACFEAEFANPRVNTSTRYLAVE